MSKLTQLKTFVKASTAELTELRLEKGDSINNDTVIDIVELPPVTQLLFWNGLPNTHSFTVLDLSLVTILDKVVNNYQFTARSGKINGDILGKTATRFTLVAAVFDGVLYDTINGMSSPAKEAIHPLVSELTEWCEDIKDVDVRRFLSHQCYDALDKIYDAIKTNYGVE